jgi:hypothetical protein
MWQYRFSHLHPMIDNMMATTHALAGVAVATLFTLIHPEYGSVAMVLAFVGGIFPDLDLYVDHRKTLHFPVYYWLFATGAGALLLVAAGPVTVGIAFFFLGAALHSTMDILGSGLELRPWQGRSERAVYNHFKRRWHRPRRWIRYDGAPEDALCGMILAIPTLLVAGASIQWLIGGTLVASVGYALVRRKVPAITERMVQSVPSSLFGYVPDRFVNG